MYNTIVCNLYCLFYAFQIYNASFFVNVSGVDLLQVQFFVSSITQLQTAHTWELPSSTTTATELLHR